MIKLDKDFDKIIKILYNDYGWSGEFTFMQREFANDIIKATKDFLAPKKDLTLKEFLDNANIHPMTYNVLIKEYLFKNKTLTELIDDVNTGEVNKHRQFGKLSYNAIKEAVEGLTK